MFKNILKYKNHLLFATGILIILFIIFIILSLCISKHDKSNKEAMENLDALGKLQQAQSLNTTNLKHSQGTMKQLMTINKELKIIINKNKKNKADIVGLYQALKKLKDQKESFENQNTSNNSKSLPECDDNCSPGEKEFLEIFKLANSDRGIINSMLAWVKIGDAYDKIYNELLVDINQNKKNLSNILFQFQLIENQKKQEAQKKMDETKNKNNYDTSGLNENFTNLEGFTNQQFADLDAFIVQNTALIHGIDVKFSTILSHMNKIKSLKDVIDGQAVQIKKIHDKLKSSSDKAIPGSHSYLKKNPNPSASDFINTKPVTGRVQ